MAFPENFFWGNSTSSMQTEGAVHEGGKGQSVYDVDFAGRQAKDWEVTVDDYHRYEEDFDLLQKMGSNMYRFQISWSRVCPTGDGDFNEEGIAFYEKLIDALIARNITPMICLYHFDMPLNLAQKYDGFLSREVVSAFVRYGKKMIDRFADKVKYWIVFNEHNLYFTSTAYHYAGVLHDKLTTDEVYSIFHHTMLAHCELAAYLHQMSQAQIGGMLAYTGVYPATTSPSDNLAVQSQEEFNFANLCEVYKNGSYSPQVLAYVKNHDIVMDFQTEDAAILAQGTVDFISFSYYRSLILSADKLDDDLAPNFYLDKGAKANPLLSANEWDWAIDSVGFRAILTRLYNRYQLPLFPIENGIGWREKWDGEHEVADDYRIDYHREHIAEMKKAIEVDGVEIIGYLGWGLIDISASSGDIEKRYGAVYVDYPTQKRLPKKSFAWFKQAFESNGENLD